VTRRLRAAVALAALFVGDCGGANGRRDRCVEPAPASEVVVCSTLTPPASGTCSVTPGDATRLFEGDVLADGRIYEGGQVGVSADGRITCVGCDCALRTPAATRIRCANGVISPGLINTHDHLSFVAVPATDTGERYEHRQDWRKGLRGHAELPLGPEATQQGISWNELRFVLGGATSTVGAGGAPGFLRNLDRPEPEQEGLAQPPVYLQTFPLGDGITPAQLTDGCDYPGLANSPDLEGVDSFGPHIAEGIDGVSRNEFLCLSSDDNGAVDEVHEKTALIQGVGLSASDHATVARERASLVWSPRSNLRLYGDTASVTAAARLGTNIALGTDWVASGSMSLLRELRCAGDFNRDYLDGFFTDEQLWQMPTRNAALATATDDVIGTLAPGKAADLAIFDAAAHPRYRAVLDAAPGDVVLVVRGGAALYGDADLVAALAPSTACDAIDVCGVAKSICAQSEIGMTYAVLQTSLGAVYPAFACGVPLDEPTCIPSRSTSVDGSSIYTGERTASDPDGDGITGSQDNCPGVFNPVRPMDGGVQADADADGAGDACDVCPVD
jgi:large repetitive protein